MSNPFQYFIIFLFGIYDHLFTLLAGCVVTVVIGIIEKRILKRPLSLKLEVGVLLAFVFFASFQAWREQYRSAKQVPTLQAQVQDQATQITNLKTNPPHVEVNLPAPVVNIPAQMAYMSSVGTGVVTSSYKIGGYIAVSSGCKNLSSSAVAENASCVIALRVVDTKPNSLKQPIVPEIIEEEEHRKFKKEIASLYTAKKSYGPGENDFKTAFSPLVDRHLDEAFRSGSKTVLMLGEYTWKDGVGEHTNQYCVWLQMYAGLFSGPGAIDPNATITWHGCKNYNGLKK
jgi:hypothetical protein